MFDPKKPVQTREGNAARILCTDRKTTTNYTTVVLITGEDGVERATNRYPDGKIDRNHDSPYDLINPPVVTTQYISIYHAQAMSKNHNSLADALKDRMQTSKGTIKLTLLDGVLSQVEIVK
jgi:hypothetical protein